MFGRATITLGIGRHSSLVAYNKIVSYDNDDILLCAFVFTQIKNFNDLSAIIAVSCVSRDPPYYPHPHNLAGTNCKDGVCIIRLNSPQNTVKYVATMLVISCYRAYCPACFFSELCGKHFVTSGRASTSMCSPTFCVPAMLPERHQWKPAVLAA